MEPHSKILVVGFGSAVLSDESVGLRIIEDLKNDSEIEDVVFKVYRFFDLEFVHEITGFDKLIIIDSILTGKADPGFIHTLELNDHKYTLHLHNYHDVDFKSVIQLFNKAGYEIPKEIMILAVEITVKEVFDDKLSVQLASKYDIIVENVKEEILKFKQNLIPAR